MPTYTVLVVGSPGLRLAALTATLRLIPRLHVVGPAIDVAAVSKCVPPDTLDLILAEWEPQRSLLSSVLEATRCHQLSPAIVLVGDEIDVHELDVMRALGIAGYLSWDDLEPLTVRWAIRAAMTGYFMLGPHVAGLSIRSLLAQPASRTPAPCLTQRELDVLRGIAAGMTEQELARAGGISTRTVKRTVVALKKTLASPLCLP